jgi:DNA repair protein RadD
MALRIYQREAIDALFDYWAAEPGNPLIDLATGTGKSMVMAESIIEILAGWPHMRIGVVTHVKELIEQNYLELLGAWPGGALACPAGIYSAGLRRKDFRAQILFGGIQTIWNKPEEWNKFGNNGWFDIIFVDECHLIPRDSSMSYGKFFAAVRKINPDVKIVGLTATPYRLDSGRLDEGDDKMFDRVIYSYGLAEGVRDGFLAPLTTKGTESEINTKGVGKLGGDYNKGKLDTAADLITVAAVEEIVRKGADRRSWLCFCSGKDHAYHTRDEIRSHGIDCESITDETSAADRKNFIEAFKNYELRALTNNSVLTTGFNHKGVDLIAAMRPTLSVSLYLQMMGRGTRPLYAPGMPLDTVEQRHAAIAAGPKPNCLILDFARLVDEHGPVDMVTIKEPGSGGGEAPTKRCPLPIDNNGEPTKPDKNGNHGCGEKLHASARVCKVCGYEFEFDESPKIEADSADVAIMASAPPDWRDVKKRQFSVNPGKGGKPDSVMVVYINGRSQIRDWICPEHKGFPADNARRYWFKHGGEGPPPSTVLEWIKRQNELANTDAILVKPGKDGYWNVKDYRTSGVETKQDEHNDGGLFQPSPKAARRQLEQEIHDEIPF